MARAVDWNRLRGLRATFLDGVAGGSDYWSDEALLADYDATFGARIRWKWDFVLEELVGRGWTPPAGDVVDWACGAAAASRSFAAAFSAPRAGLVSRVRLVDRSPLATGFAMARLREEHPDLEVASERECGEPAGTLLVSHVLTELSPSARREPIERARRADAVLWVEPGTPAASRALLEVREALRGELHLIAPCTHSGACGLSAPHRERDWCHQFAPPPREAFASAHWARVGRELAIDLRSLPVSFLVLDRRPPAPQLASATRLVGRPRAQKGRALLLGCDASGVRERIVRKRAAPELHRACSRDEVPSLGRWCVDGDDVTSIEPVSAPEARRRRS